MRYLTDAWNRKDADALRHVTNPGARDELDAMHAEAVNLRLDECYPRPGHGDYECTFIHDIPKNVPTSVPNEQGRAAFVVGPANGPGWYMTVFEYCGG